MSYDLTAWYLSGANWGAPLEEYPDQAFSKVGKVLSLLSHSHHSRVRRCPQVMNLNVQRVFTLTQKLVPLLRKGAQRDRTARVINVGCRDVAMSIQG